jgi:hypothetical protein
MSDTRGPSAGPGGVGHQSPRASLPRGILGDTRALTQPTHHTGLARRPRRACDRVRRLVQHGRARLRRRGSSTSTVGLRIHLRRRARRRRQRPGMPGLLAGPRRAVLSFGAELLLQQHLQARLHGRGARGEVRERFVVSRREAVLPGLTRARAQLRAPPTPTARRVLRSPSGGGRVSRQGRDRSARSAAGIFLGIFLPS